MANPLQSVMRQHDITDAVMSAMVNDGKSDTPVPESIRHIREGHRRPSWELAFAIEAPLLAKGWVADGFAEELRDWKHYPLAKDRPRRQKRAA